MERERVECGLVTESEKEALIYSLDIVRVALQSGRRLKIFQRDIYLRYLEEVLLDNDIDPGAFFDFSEFRKEMILNLLMNGVGLYRRFSLKDM